MTNIDDVKQSRSTAASVVILVAASLVALFAFAFIAGMVMAGAEHEGPHSAAYYAILVGAVLVAAGAIYAIVRNLAAFRLPSSPRMRKSRILLYACLAIGLVAGIGLGVAEDPDSVDMGTLFSTTASISSTAALLLVGSFLLATALSARWHMLLDEHERLAYDFGAVAALYVYLTVSICWWLLARGGLAPAPDGYVIFWLTMIVWAIGWVIRRYR
jgi:hypothetical protein